jgi:hypothetical protein
MKFVTAVLLPCIVAAVGCGPRPTGNPQPGDPKPPPDSGIDSGIPWQPLISATWTLPAGTEGYKCVRHTVTEEIFAGGFEAMAPLGTHHTLLTMGQPNAPDGLSNCNAGTNFALSVSGSGVGSQPIVFPKGVAFQIPKGVQLLLNLHLFNTGQTDLTGTSGIRAYTVAASEVVERAEGMLAGTMLLNIPAGATTKHIGYCTIARDWTLFAVSPHMHQLGTYEKVVAETREFGEVTLFDGPYNFHDQSYHLIPPLHMAKGDRVRVECTHQNPTTRNVRWGESSLDEMCFVGIYRYPATGAAFACSDDFASLLGPRPGGSLRPDAGSDAQ